MLTATVPAPEHIRHFLCRLSLLLHNDGHTIATDVWQTPEEISDKLTGNNFTLGCLSALHEKYGDDIHLLFDCSIRDGDLAKVQNYFDTGVMDVTEKEADIYQQILKDTVPQFKEAGVSLFIWDEEQNQSVAGWLADAETVS